MFEKDMKFYTPDPFVRERPKVDLMDRAYVRANVFPKLMRLPKNKVRLTAAAQFDPQIKFENDITFYAEVLREINQQAARDPTIDWRVLRWAAYDMLCYNRPRMPGQKAGSKKG